MWPFERKLKIVSFGDLESGCYLARIVRPLFELKRRGHKVKMIREGYVEGGTDIVVFNNLMVAPFEDMFRDFRKMKCKVVYDVDDAMEYSRDLRVIRMLDTYRFLLKNADLITTTTETLAEHLRTLTDKSVAVLPNCLDPREFPERKKHERLRIGFAGSPSHSEDIKIVLDVIAELKKKYDFDFVTLGLNPNPKKKGYEWKQPVAAEKYPETLSKLGFDIGIVPLVENKFNRNKSCIKFYEYALSGAVTIASDVLPFSKEPMLKVKNEFHDWYYKLEGLITNQKMRESVSKEQREWVLANRDITKTAKLWEKEYRKKI